MSERRRVAVPQAGRCAAAAPPGRGTPRRRPGTRHGERDDEPRQRGPADSGHRSTLIRDSATGGSLQACRAGGRAALGPEGRQAAASSLQTGTCTNSCAGRRAAVSIQRGIGGGSRASRRRAAPPRNRSRRRAIRSGLRQRLGVIHDERGETAAPAQQPQRLLDMSPVQLPDPLVVLPSCGTPRSASIRSCEAITSSRLRRMKITR